MGFCTALLYDRVMRRAEDACLLAWRLELLAGAHGDVLELGAGTGVNLPLYPRPAVRRVVAAEPDRHMRKRLVRRAEAFEHVEVHASGGVGLPFADASFDCVVTTLVLCTVPDPAETLAEARRVLRPSGVLLFLEHVADEHDPRRARWQRRLEPAWKWFADGCHLTRRTEAAIRGAGFSLGRIDRDEMRSAPAWVRPTIRGVARRD